MYKRICRAEIYTKNQKTYISDNCEPRGEAHENIGIDWLCDKFRRITAPAISKEKQEELISLICSNESKITVRTIVDAANNK